MADYVFKRYELKYLLNPAQYRTLSKAVSELMCPDAYGETTIQSLYFDTDDFRLVRASLEKPVYKEKLRLRCYGLNDGTRDVFLEMKRKYDGIVYKRRVSLKESELADVISGDCCDTQIHRELLYFFSFYKLLSPKIMLLYDRVAWFDKNSDLRITFDQNIRYRTDTLNCHTSLDGIPLMDTDCILMECKTSTAYPLWLSHLICRENIDKTSFSKYGAAYEKLFRNCNSEFINKWRISQ